MRTSSVDVNPVELVAMRPRGLATGAVAVRPRLNGRQVGTIGGGAEAAPGTQAN